MVLILKLGLWHVIFELYSQENVRQKAVKASTRLQETEDRSMEAEIRYKREATNGFHKDASPSLNLGGLEVS